MTSQPQSLSSILAHTTIDDPEEVLSSANADLKKNKADSQAQHAKVVALLKSDRYDEALQFFDTVGDSLKDKARIELSYTLYKVGRLEEAASVAAKAQTRAAKHVAAQSLYRSEAFLEAASLYDELKDGIPPHEEQDLRINKGAVEAQLTWQGKGDRVHKKRPDREDLEAFETAFNAACGSVARGEFGQADVLLKRARELCRHSDLPEDEKAGELLNISVQQLYVLSKLGKHEEAKGLAADINVEDVPDLSTRKVAHSTLLSLESKPGNPFQVHKIFNSAPKTVGNDKLFSFQSDAHISNSFTIDLLARKYDGVKRSTTKAIKSNPAAKTSPSIVSLSVLNAASQLRGATGKTAAKSLVPKLEQWPDDVGLVLLLVQLYMSYNNASSAIGTLESFFKRLDSVEGDKDLRYNPGLIATLIALYKVQGRKAHVEEELNKAATYWRQKSDNPPEILLLEAGKALLDNNISSAGLESAREIFSTLHKQYPEDKEINAGYIASHASTSSPEIIESSLSKLPPLSKIISDIDVAALEEAGIPQPTLSAARKASIANALIGGKRPAVDSQTSGTTKRRRLPKSRIPKDFVEGKQLDPDRWLPLRERASYRPKKSKKGKNRDGGTQGGVVKEEVGAPKSEQPGVISGSGGGGKKKGKGKKR